MKNQNISSILSKKIIAIILICIIVVTPISFAADFFSSSSSNVQSTSSSNYVNNPSNSYDFYTYDSSYLDSSQDLGESIVVNVVDIEPPVPLKSKLIEDSNVPIYVYLGGHTFGSMFFGESGPNFLMSKPKINNAYVTLQSGSSNYVYGSPYYVRPRSVDVSMDNLGYLVVLLKRIPKEADVPEEIVLNMSMNMEFDLTTGYGDIALTDLVLNEFSDEEAWKSNETGKEQDSFWNGKGYLRLIDAEGSRARIQIYSSGVTPILLTGTDSYAERGIIDLTEGESKTVIIPGTSAFFNDVVKIKLNRVGDKTDSAKIIIKSGDQIIYKELTEGERLLPGSDWKIKTNGITEESSGNKVKQTVILENSYGDTKELTKSYEESGKDKPEPVTDSNLVSVENSVCPESIIIQDYSSEKTKIEELLNEAESISAEKTIEGTTTSSGQNVISGEIERKTEPAKKLYCTAVSELKKSLTGDSSDSEAYKIIAQSYDKLSDFYNLGENVVLDSDSQKMKDNVLGLASYYYKKAGLTDDSTNIEEKRAKSVDSQKVWIMDEGINVELDKVSILKSGTSGKTYAKINFDGKEKDYYENNVIYSHVSNDVSIKWVVTNIENDYVKIKRYENNKEVGTLELRSGRNENKEIEGKKIELVDAKTSRVAYVTMYPGSGRTYSKSNFLVHIPIEKRLDQLTLSPEEIDNLIEDNENTINKLDKNIDELTKLIKTWTNACLLTWTYLMIKSSFSGGALDRNKARKDVMPMYSQYCSDHIGRQQGNYKTYDDCMNDLSGEIESNLDYAQTVIKNSNECEKTYRTAEGDYADQEPEGGMTSIQEKCGASDIEGLSNFDTLKNSAGIDYSVSEQDFSDYYKYCVGYQQNDNFKININGLGNSYYANEITDNCNQAKAKLESESKSTETALSLLENINYKESNYEDYLSDRSKFEKLSTEEQQKIVGEYNFAKSLALQEEEFQPKTIEDFKKEIEKSKGLGNVDVLLRVSNKDDDNFIGYKRVSSGEYETLNLEIPTWGDVASNAPEAYQKEINTRCASIAEQEACKSEVNKQKVNIDGINLYKSGSQLYIAYSEFTYAKTGERFDYSTSAKIEVDDKGRPYCLPAGNGNFYQIKGGDDAWNTRGEPISESISYWNVGADGKLCTEDDVLVADSATLSRDKSKSSEAKSLAKNVRCKEGDQDVIKTAGRSWDCTDNQYKVDQNLATGHCQDVMDPSDCKTLFLVCDPVVCPASRFNLGGAYNFGVDESIAQKGIIAALILGQKNFNKPVCLPGILAGLKNIKSVLVSFNECLYAQKVNGENIGICDTIRSVGICEIIWREAITVFNLRGSIINMISEKLYYGRESENSGGEYLSNLNQRIDVLGENIDYFTNQYATSTFNAFKGKSTEEIGSEICKAGIYGKVSDVSDLVNQIAEPENPPQATAWFSESPWSVKGGQTVNQYGKSTYSEQSEYSVYYHIYAGNIAEFAKTGYSEQGIRYSVYLTNRDRSYILPVVSNNPNQYYDTVAYESNVDKSIITYGPSGLEQICIWLNGQESCGYGTASTLFSIQSIKDQFAEDEASNANIDSMEECVPSSGTTSPSLGSLTLPRNYGIFSTGIIRTCSVRDPNSDEPASSKGRWSMVGTCGEDEQGRNLGYCWLDTESISVQNIYEKEDLIQNITLDEQKLESSLSAIDSEKIAYFDADNSKAAYQNLESEYSTIKESDDMTDLVELLAGSKLSANSIPINYRELAIYSQDIETKILSQRRVGEIYKLIGDTIIAPNYNIFVKSENTKGTIEQTTTTETTASKETTEETKYSKINAVIFQFDDGNIFNNYYIYYVFDENEGWKWSKDKETWISVNSVKDSNDWEPSQTFKDIITKLKDKNYEDGINILINSVEDTIIFPDRLITENVEMNSNKEFLIYNEKPENLKFYYGTVWDYSPKLEESGYSKDVLAVIQNLKNLNLYQGAVQIFDLSKGSVTQGELFNRYIFVIKEYPSGKPIKKENFFNLCSLNDLYKAGKINDIKTSNKENITIGDSYEVEFTGTKQQLLEKTNQNCVDNYLNIKESSSEEQITDKQICSYYENIDECKTLQNSCYWDYSKGACNSCPEKQEDCSNIKYTSSNSVKEMCLSCDNLCKYESNICMPKDKKVAYYKQLIYARYEISKVANLFYKSTDDKLVNNIISNNKNDLYNLPNTDSYYLEKDKCILLQFSEEEFNALSTAQKGSLFISNSECEKEGVTGKSPEKWSDLN